MDEKNLSINEQLSDDGIIEKTLMYLFSNEKGPKQFPYIPVQMLKRHLIEKANIQFNDPVAYNSFFSDLQITCREAGLPSSAFP